MSYLKFTILILLLSTTLITACDKSSNSSKEIETEHAVNHPKALTSDEKFSQLLKKAESGDSNAQTEIGWNYYYGNNVDRDVSKALNWFKRASDSGHAESTFMTGKILFRGESGSKDISTGLNLITKAANSGFPNAIYRLGVIYSNGDETNKDLNKARLWLEKLAVQDDLAANFRLHIIYLEEGWENKDDEKSKEYWDKALVIASKVNKGDSARTYEALYFMGWSYFYGVEIDYDLIKGIELLNKASEFGKNSDAQYLLGWLYYGGYGEISKNSALAIEYWKKAANQGSQNAIYVLGYIYNTGDYIPKDDNISADWYEKGAAIGDSRSQYNIAYAYLSGAGRPIDLVLAYAYANLANSSLGGDAVWWKIKHERYAFDNPDDGYAVNLKYLDMFNKPDEPFSARGHITTPAELRDKIERKLTSAEINEAQELATNWVKGQPLKRKSSQNSSLDKNFEPKSLKKVSSGTAFIVSEQGHAITNAHVVNGCSELRLGRNGDKFNLEVKDSTNDLALLKFSQKMTSSAKLEPNVSKIRQGDEVVVFGYPWKEILSSSGNLTQGILSGITGLGNNTSQIQITAPIQPGSSGSPVLNRRGYVMGVVSQKINDLKMLESTKTLPQNINFAVSGQTLKAFLDANKVSYTTGRSWFLFDKEVAEIAEDARKWTVIVECWN